VKITKAQRFDTGEVWGMDIHFDNGHSLRVIGQDAVYLYDKPSEQTIDGLDNSDCVHSVSVSD
jgi:hypothetical protein